MSEIDTDDPQSVASAVNVFISANLKTERVDPVEAAKEKESAANFGGSVYIDEEAAQAKLEQEQEVQKVGVCNSTFHQYNDPVCTQRRFDVYTTSITSRRRRFNV